MSHDKKTLVNKWGKEALSMGWTAIPTSLFFLQGALNMTPVTFNVLLHLLIHWWNPTEWPHPSQKSIAVRMGVSVRTVQRSLKELEVYGLLNIVKTSRTNPKYKGRNIYDLSKLQKSLNILTPDIDEKLNGKNTSKINSKPSD